MSPFRELFVEVAEALLEGAVHQAEDSKPKTFGRHALHIDLNYATREICKARGILWTETYKRAEHPETVVRVKLPCRHSGRYLLDERAIFALGMREFVDYIIDVFEAPPERKCTCIPYEPPTPCTHGVCE